MGITGIQGLLAYTELLAYRGYWHTRVTGIRGLLAYRGDCHKGVTGIQGLLAYRGYWQRGVHVEERRVCANIHVHRHINMLECN